MFVAHRVHHIVSRRMLYSRAIATASLKPLTESLEPLSQRISSFPNAKLWLGLGAGFSLAALHSATGSANNFYDYRFKSKQNPDDLASFYGGEELMELFCIFPFVGKIMMRNAQFDDTGNIITTGFPGTMHVSMVFSDEANEDTGETDWFNKRERFTTTLFDYTLWDMVLNFGFRTLEDGSRECYHVGEYFHGNLPVLSQIMLLVFKVHARWVVWSTEHHINHYAFGSSYEDEDKAEEFEHQSRANMPFFLLTHYAWSDLSAMLFGTYDRQKEPSFLVKMQEDEQKLWNFVQDKSEKDLVKLEVEVEKDKLPFQQKAIQIQIMEDIEDDKRVMKELLARHSTKNAQDVKTLLAKRHTIAVARRRTTGGKVKELNSSEEDTYQMATTLAMDRAQQRMVGAESDAYTVAKDIAADRAQIRRMTRRMTRLNRLAPSNVEELDMPKLPSGTEQVIS